MKKIKTYFLWGFFALFVFLATPFHEAKARTPSEITRSGIIKIAICDDLPPIQFKDADGGFSGLDPDLGKMIAEALGVKPEWKIIGSPKFRAEMLMNKNVDLVISSFSITRERLEVINLSDPYFTTGLGIMIRRGDRGKIKSYDDLAGKTVVTTKGSSGEKLLFDLGLDARVIPLADTHSSFEHLAKGLADAVINDRVYLDDYVSEKSDFLVLDGTLSANQYGVGMNLQDKELLSFVNSFLNSIRKDGRLDSLIARYVKGRTVLEAAKENSLGYRIYEVQESDTLSGLARKFYNDPTKWDVIYSNNPDTIKIANILTPGWKIRIPDLTVSVKESAAVHSEKSAYEGKDSLKTVMNGSLVSGQALKKIKNSSKIQEYDLIEIEKNGRSYN